MDENWVELGGTNFAGALKLAITTLKETGQKNNALILSDGEKHDEKLSEIIEEAKRAGVYILAVGVGTDDGGGSFPARISPTAGFGWTARRCSAACNPPPCAGWLPIRTAASPQPPAAPISRPWSSLPPRTSTNSK